MATFELILLLGIAVLISSIVDQFVPKVSLPLIQIGLGVVIAFLAISPVTINIEPELFLILFIAPLLFSDALEADKKNLWENKGTILSFAIGLVIVITLCVGFAVNALIPSIPLAAAFALGAALGPTDAVAVQALKQEAQPKRREGAILQGEALVNDASGVVSFQFAIAAAVTGFFSLLDATTSLLFSFIGGIVLGIILAVLFLFISSKIRDLGLYNITFHVLFEVSMPFVVFLISELIGVSGILAVVACGIVWSLNNDKKVSPYRSRLNIALSSVWKVLGFALNGIVFVFLGTQLPMAMQSTWGDVYINNFVVIGYVLGITALIVVLRFLWALGMTCVARNPETGKRDKLTKNTIRNALITTVGGPKGAITLSIIFSIPFFLSDGSDFPQRSLIIFLASGVILCTLLLANFLLPVLAPKEDDEDEKTKELQVIKIEILRMVIERLIADSDDDIDRETNDVIRSYNMRIASIRDASDLEPPSTTKLRIQVIDYQADKLLEASNKNEVDYYLCFTYLRRIMQQKYLLAHEKESLWSFQKYLGHVRVLFQAIKKSISELFNIDVHLNDEEMRKIRIKGEEYAIEFLSSLVNDPNYPSEVVAKLMISHETVLSILQSSDEDVESPGVLGEKSRLREIQRKGLQYEIQEIQDHYASGQLTRLQAKEMRDNVSLMMIDVEDHV